MTRKYIKKESPTTTNTYPTKFGASEVIIDKKSYEEFEKLRESLIGTDNKPGMARIVSEENEDIVIDAQSPQYIIEKALRDLSEKERKRIRLRLVGVKALIRKMERARKKAFGVEIDKENPIALDSRKSELLEHFAHYKTKGDVHKIVVQEWGLPVSRKSINRFYNDNLDKINEMKADYIKDHSGIRLTHKKARLEEYTELYEVQKERWNKHGQRSSDYKLLLETLHKIKGEVDIPSLKIEGQINHKIETTINLHVQQDLFKGMSINDIIIGRVASKEGVSASFLVSRLHNSFYAKHTGLISSKVDGLMDEEIIYPSSIVYDWKEIEDIHTVRKGEIEDQMAVEVVDDEGELNKAKQIKELMKAKVKEKRQEVNRSQGRIDSANNE